VTFVILFLVVAVLWYRGTPPEDRKRYGVLAMDSLAQLKAAATRPRPEYDTFREALRARMPRVIATPVIIFIIAAVFGGMLFGATAIGDPDTLVAWGGSLGTRTTNYEWWRLATSTFVHTGPLHLLIDVAVLIQLGVILERLVGRLTFTAVYLSAGVFAGLVNLSSRPVEVTVGSSGAVFGLYGFVCAALIWQTFHGWQSQPEQPGTEDLVRHEVKIPVIAMRRLAIGATVFIIYSALSGVAGAAEFTGLLVGMMYGVTLARRAGEKEPTARHAAYAMLATGVVAVACAVGIGHITDVRPEIVRVLDTEKSTAATYQEGLDAFKKGRITAEALARLAELTIVTELQSADARLEALSGVPREHKPIVADAREYLRLRCASWRARGEAIRRMYGDRPDRPAGVEDAAWHLQLERRFRAENAARGTAEAAERASLDALQRITRF
jgi:membrane associated rhomboid family serine protease